MRAIKHTTGALAAAALLGTAAAAPAAAAPSEPEYTPPTLESLSEETYGTLSLGEGAAGYPVDQEFTVMLDAEELDVPETVDLWLIPPEGGEAIHVAEGPTESDVYENPGSPTYEPREVELAQATIDSEDLDYSGLYGLAAVDPEGELFSWRFGTVQAEQGDSLGAGAPGYDEDSGTPDEDLWPIPSSEEEPEPATEPPTLEDLTEEGYGAFGIGEETPVLPLDATVTVQDMESTAVQEFWLLPADGGEAIHLNTEEAQSGNPGEPFTWEVATSSEGVTETGIYALVGTNGAGSAVGWTPFGVSPDGEPIQPGDPGVNEEDTNADREIWPIPDSVPVPE